ncbi:hypothetical protein Tco_1185047 [Tanacetum coccineum]
MSIPNTMMNDDIKNSVAYLTYIALSTNFELPKVGKGKGKGPTGKKKVDTPTPKEKKKKDAPKMKSSITADNNILPDPDEALKLGKSISLTEVEEKEEERRLHETHSRLVIEKAADDVDSEETKDEADDRVIQRRPTGVIIGGPVRKVFDEEKLDHSQKLKGIETLSATAQLIFDMKTATKASKRAYRIQQHLKDSSEGSCVNPEVPDESKDGSVRSSSSSSSLDDETEVISFDDETAESKKAVVEEKQADDQEKAADEEKADKEINDAEKDENEKT